MWFKLASATFTTHLGKMSDLSSTVRVNLDAAGFTISGDALSFDKEDSNQRREYTLTLKSNYEIQNTVEAEVETGNASADISGGTDGVYTLVVTAATAPTSEVKVKVSGAVYVGTELPEVPDDGGDEPTNPPSDDPTTPNTITWELGAIISNSGPNSADLPTQRIRTAGYLQVESSITIKATGNVEFCPIYYGTDKTYISSPNKYQTTDCVVNASDYPLVRLMIRDKTNTSKDLTSSLTELGNSVVVTGNFVEIPYDETSGGGTSGTTGATGIGEGATWQSGAIDSNSGNGSVVMASRIHTGFIPLGNVTVSVSGDAEFCPFFYNADKTYIKPSTTPTYQKTTQTWTSADGAYLVLMARNSTNTSATIDPSYGANVNIQIN